LAAGGVRAPTGPVRRTVCGISSVIVRPGSYPTRDVRHGRLYAEIAYARTEGA